MKRIGFIPNLSMMQSQLAPKYQHSEYEIKSSCKDYLRKLSSPPVLWFEKNTVTI